MKPNLPDSQNSQNLLTNIVDTLLRIDTWQRLLMFMILTSWLVLAWDFVANKAETQRSLFTSFAGPSRRPVLFAEDYAFINSLLKKYPGSNISVIEVNYLAGIASQPLTNIKESDQVVLNKSGVPVAAILISPTTPQGAKEELVRYFKGNDNISPVLPLQPSPVNGQSKPSRPSPNSSPLVKP